MIRALAIAWCLMGAVFAVSAVQALNHARAGAHVAPLSEDCYTDMCICERVSADECAALLD
jgi:hypothetical protein